jgi:hypothetical protein
MADTSVSESKEIKLWLSLERLPARQFPAGPTSQDKVFFSITAVGKSQNIQAAGRA